MGRIKVQWVYLSSLLKFGFDEKPVLWLSAVLAFVTSGLDILTMGLLYPLTLVAQNIPITQAGFAFRYIPTQFLTTKCLVLAFIFCLGLRMLSTLVNQGIILRAGKSLHAIISSRIFGIVVKDIPLSKLNANGIGYYTSIAGDESFRASTTIINLSQFLNLLFLTLSYYVAIAIFSFRSFLLISAFIFISAILMSTVFRRIHRLGVMQAEMSRTAGMVFVDAINNVKSIRCYSAEGLVHRNYSKKVTDYVGVLFRVDFYQVFLRSGPILLLLLFVGILVEILLGARQALDLPFLIALFAFLSRFFPSLGLCLNTALRLISDSKSGKDVIGLLRESQPGNVSEDAGSLGSIEHISFENISFQYDEKKILDGFSYSFQAGESYVIIGPSGVGKSTLLDLLLKFYSPSTGGVFVNGRALGLISDAEIRKKVALMEQRVTIFNESILMNITLGADVSLEEVRRACKMAKIDGFIESLPGQYDFVIQYLGANLSGGQRQRIALARAILRNPEVLVLDESLSALDVQTKEAIFLDLKEIFKSKILISVSHDPWVISNSSVTLDFGNL